MPIQVDVCIATFKRQALLRELLDSIERQDLPTETTVRIVVVDNDKIGSAIEVVKIFSATSNIQVVYEIEPIQNIARTRNRALSLATGDYVAFIDDDEIAAPDWLKQLLKAREAYAADVVFGPVISDLPQDPPKWIVDGHFFKRECYPTGSLRPHGATNNSLVKMQLLREIRFSESFGLTGGEDIELFARIRRQKAIMVWCDEAMTYEKVPPERMTLRWLIRRSFRGGQTVPRVFFGTMTKTEKFVWSGKRIIGLCYVFLIPLVWLLGKHCWISILLKFAENLGQITGLSKFHFKEYAS
jgi:succinoglycan biosynthesis protein ExoM